MRGVTQGREMVMKVSARVGRLAACCVVLWIVGEDVVGETMGERRMRERDKRGVG